MKTRNFLFCTWPCLSLLGSLLVVLSTETKGQARRVYCVENRLYTPQKQDTRIHSSLASFPSVRFEGYCAEQGWLFFSCQGDEGLVLEQLIRTLNWEEVWIKPLGVDQSPQSVCTTFRSAEIRNKDD